MPHPSPLLQWSPSNKGKGFKKSIGSETKVLALGEDLGEANANALVIMK